MTVKRRGGGEREAPNSAPEFGCPFLPLFFFFRRRFSSSVFFFFFFLLFDPEILSDPVPSLFCDGSGVEESGPCRHLYERLAQLSS